jgi:hypothetical protein
MATGTQSSAQLRPAFAAATPQPPQTTPAAQPGVLRSGEVVATSMDALQDAASKTYYSMVKGCQFVMPNGLALQFLGGRYVTNKEDEIFELDRVSNRSGSLIFTKAEAKDADAALAHKAAEETQNSDGAGAGPLVPAVV